VTDRAAALNSALLRLLAEARKEEGLSMETLAEQAEVDRTYVSRLEGGERQPTVAVAAALAHALGLSLSDLLARAERIVEGDDATEGGTELEIVPAPPSRTVNRERLGSDTLLRSSTGLSGDVIAAALDDTYHTLDMLDRQLVENGVAPFARLVEYNNLSSMLGNIVGGAIARHSGGLYERSGAHKYQDLRSTADGEHVEIKIALENNKPKGHLSKEGYYLTFRYVLANRDGSYARGERGEVVCVWEVRFGYLYDHDFDESNTPGDSGKTAVVKTEILKAMERVYFDPDYFPYARLEGPWGVAASGGDLPSRDDR
jgi:transcriptional regulator with XRE-family HTH domain